MKFAFKVRSICAHCIICIKKKNKKNIICSSVVMFRSHLRLKNCVSNCNWKQSKELKISHIRTKKCIISIIWKEQSRLEGVDGHSFPSSLPIKSREQIFWRERVTKRTCFWQYFITLIISIFRFCSFNSIYGHRLKIMILF